MVRRGQPWRCITDGCLNGTRDDTHRCEDCRGAMRELNEQILAADLDRPAS